MTILRNALILLLFSMLLLSACTNPFHPKLWDNSSDVIRNRTPREVLENLELAYKQKNIDTYSALLHTDFRFYLISSEANQIGIDANGDGIKDDYWDRDKELEITRNIFEYGSSNPTYSVPDVISLRLNIPPEEVWEIDMRPEHENWIIIPCTFTLSMSINNGSGTLSATGTARFYLASFDNTWYIMEWWDESNL